MTKFINGDIPCILHVRLEISGHKLHDLHNVYPLAPESIKLELKAIIPNLNNF